MFIILPPETFRNDAVDCELLYCVGVKRHGLSHNQTSVQKLLSRCV